MHATQSELSTKLRNGIEIWVGQAVFKLLDNILKFSFWLNFIYQLKIGC